MIPVVLDCETDLIQPGRLAPDLACVAIWARGSHVLLGRDEWLATVRDLLQAPQVLLVGHNMAFDMAVLANEAPALLPLIFRAYEEDRITCTEVRQKLIDVANGHRKFHGGDDEEGVQKSAYNLETLAWRILRRKLDKDTWRLQYGKLKHVPIAAWPEGARTYPVEDTRAESDLYDAQEEQAWALGDQFRQARAAFWIYLMKAWGIHTNAQGIYELAEKTGREYETVAAELRGLGLLRPDKKVKRKATGLVEVVPGSRDTKAAQARIVAAYQAQGLPWPLTDGGAPCLNEQACIDSHDIVLVQYARLTSLKTVLSKDIPALEGGITYPIHSYFDTLLETGRVSSSRPNIQNVRRLPGIRECFIPRAGTVFISSDYGGLELCTLAQVCISLLGRSRLAQALNEGWDPHLMIAAQILGRDYGELKKIKAQGPGRDCVAGNNATLCRCQSCQVDNARQTGKVANFGFPGGLGPEALVSFALMNYGVRITVDEARTLKKVWLNTWPEMRKYFDLIDAQVNKPGARICQLFAQRWRGGLRYTSACNTMFQGLGADIAKAAGWLVARACYIETESPLYGCRIVNFVHDEFILECPEGREHEAAHELARLMVLAAVPWLPDVKIKCEPLAMRQWSKKAKAVVVDGRLVPWDMAA